MIRHLRCLSLLCLVGGSLCACTNGIGIGVEIPVGENGEVIVKSDGKGGTKIGVGVTVQN